MLCIQLETTQNWAKLMQPSPVQYSEDRIFWCEAEYARRILTVLGHLGTQLTSTSKLVIEISRFIYRVQVAARRIEWMETFVSLIFISVNETNYRDGNHKNWRKLKIVKKS